MPTVSESTLNVPPPPKTLLQRLLSPTVWHRIFYGAGTALILYAIVALFDGVFYDSRKIDVSIALFVLSVVLLLFGVATHLLRDTKTLLPDKWESLPPSPDDIVCAHQLTQYILRSIRPGTVNVIAGASGSGKTTLLNIEARNEITKDGAVFLYIDNYNQLPCEVAQRLRTALKGDDLGTKFVSEINNIVMPLRAHNPRQLPQELTTAAMDNLGRLLINISKHKEIYIIFDQFEPELARINTSPDICLTYDNFIHSVISASNLKFVLVIRKEWLIDALRFTGGLRVEHELIILPPPITCATTINASNDAQAEAWENWREFYEDFGIEKGVVHDLLSKLTARTDGFLKIEARIAYITIKSTYGKDLTRDQLELVGGVDGLIKAYFSRLLSSAPNENIATKILIALAAETAYLGCPRSERELSILVHEEQDNTNANIKFLENSGVIQRAEYAFEGRDEGGGYILRHEYVADFVHNSSSIHVSASDRDNIRIFANAVSKGRPLHTFVSYIRPPEFTLSRAFMCIFFIAFFVQIVRVLFTADTILSNSRVAFAEVNKSHAFCDKAFALFNNIFYGRDPLWSQLPENAVHWYMFIILLVLAFPNIIALFYYDSINRGFLHVVLKRGVRERKLLTSSSVFDVLITLFVLPLIYCIIYPAFMPLFGPLAVGIVVLIQMLCVSGGRYSRQSRKDIRKSGVIMFVTLLSASFLMTSLIWGIGYGAVFIFHNSYVIIGLYVLLSIICAFYAIMMCQLHASGEALSGRRAYFDRLSGAGIYTTGAA